VGSVDETGSGGQPYVQPARLTPSAPRRSKPPAGPRAGVSVALFYGVSLLPTEWLSRADAGTSRPVPDLTDRVDPLEDHIRGSVDAPVTLLEYGDFECPHCGRAAAVVEEVLAQYPDDVRFVFRHLPLPDVHANAALAAEAAEAAAAQGAFWPMHDTLYAHQDALQTADLVGYAADLGLDAKRFERDLRGGRFGPRVARDVNSAEEAGVAGTPTFFIDDVRYRGRYDRASLTEAVAAAVDLARTNAMDGSSAEEDAA
jgi:protein-disulfide isomerase